ncbi:unnamed protein product, partial [Mesorhabditis belari]|uniref:Uncharacterized protein n=1 Tax=Mesorhabditis belari TaxID=2138241 RepID=A0AAF3EM41_9BILA
MKSPATSFKCKRDVLWKVVLEKIRFLADISIELIPKNGKVPDFWIEFLSRFRQVRNFHLHMHGTLKDGNAALLEHWFPVVLNGFVLRTVDDYSTKEALFQRVQLQNTKHFVLKQEKWKELSATRADSYTFNRYVRDSLHDFWTIGQPGTNPRAKVMLYDDPCFYFATKQDCLASIERLLRDNVVKVLINLDDAIVWMPNSTGEPVSIREFTLQPQNLAINPLVSEKFARFAQVEEEISRFHFRNSNEMLERSSVTVYFRHYDHKGRVLLIIARICFKQDIDFDAFQARHYPFQLQVVLDFL